MVVVMVVVHFDVPLIYLSRALSRSPSCRSISSSLPLPSVFHSSSSPSPSPTEKEEENSKKTVSLLLGPVGPHVQHPLPLDELHLAADARRERGPAHGGGLHEQGGAAAR